MIGCENYKYYDIWNSENFWQNLYQPVHDTGVNRSKMLQMKIAVVYYSEPVYNDHLMGYFSAFWSSSRWPLAT